MSRVSYRGGDGGGGDMSRVSYTLRVVGNGG